MEKCKKWLSWVAVGCVLGGIATSWIAPKLIAWYFDPPVEMAINCKAPIHWAFRKLQWAQLLGTLAGGMSFGLLPFLFRRRNTGLELEP